MIPPPWSMELPWVSGLTVGKGGGSDDGVASRTHPPGSASAWPCALTASLYRFETAFASTLLLARRPFFVIAGAVVAFFRQRRKGVLQNVRSSGRQALQVEHRLLLAHGGD